MISATQVLTLISLTALSAHAFRMDVRSVQPNASIQEGGWDMALMLDEEAASAWACGGNCHPAVPPTQRLEEEKQWRSPIGRLQLDPVAKALAQQTSEVILAAEETRILEELTAAAGSHLPLSPEEVLAEYSPEAWMALAGEDIVAGEAEMRSMLGLDKPIRTWSSLSVCFLTIAAFLYGMRIAISVYNMESSRV
eukprot:TRINITY_DN105704_c0_g1_i1.p1 TRINITY_DN105704_c0_g1~~TRINITY_DN105704_c0_g1_i1.p1  ORF type:complete len:195 (+),score=42.97 TRINITY_DN105704_c0_g1_i1:91-675(+)